MKRNVQIKANKFNIATLGFKTNDYMMAREWISKDFMIIECAKASNIDVCLSLDKNTFLPLAHYFDCFTAYCLPDNFEHSEYSILKYNHEKVEVKNIKLS